MRKMVDSWTPLETPFRMRTVMRRCYCFLFFISIGAVFSKDCDNYRKRKLSNGQYRMQRCNFETLGCRPMYPECVAFLRKTMRVREIVILMHLSHSHSFAQKRNAFRIHGMAPLYYFVESTFVSKSLSIVRDRQRGVNRLHTTIRTCHLQTIDPSLFISYDRKSCRNKSGFEPIAPRCLIHMVEREFRRIEASKSHPWAGMGCDINQLNKLNLYGNVKNKQKKKLFKEGYRTVGPNPEKLAKIQKKNYDFENLNRRVL